MLLSAPTKQYSGKHNLHNKVPNGTLKKIEAILFESAKEVQQNIITYQHSLPPTNSCYSKGCGIDVCWA